MPVCPVGKKPVEFQRLPVDIVTLRRIQIDDLELVRIRFLVTMIGALLTSRGKSFVWIELAKP